MSPSPSLASRAALAIGLMVGFYLLAFAMIGALLYIPYAAVSYADRVPVKALLFCIIGAGLIAWSIIPRPDRFVAPGPRLASEEHADLFKILNAMSADVQQEMPKEVFLVSDLNAWVAERGGVMGLGSRRVMGLGLPLLQVLSISQMRAVLAHEFGHFYGGDTKLGPWIYKTRAAIGRTIQNLLQQGSSLARPFIWYGNMFLRVTHAISRQQEFSADALAARTVGAQPLIEGLKVIHGMAAAYGPYWQNEAVPVLNAGRRPPLAEGFAKFVGSAEVSTAIANVVDAELKEGKVEPYDTHPPLRERIAALEGLPAGNPPPCEARAISLISGLDEMERRLVAVLAGEQVAQELKPVRWEDAGKDVFLPIWKSMIKDHPRLLEDLQWDDVPRVARDLRELASKVVDPPGRLRSPEERQAIAFAVLGAAIAVTLEQRGWTLHALPGELYYEQQGFKIEPFQTVQKLAEQESKADEWTEMARRGGLTGFKFSELAAPRPN